MLVVRCIDFEYTCQVQLRAADEEERPGPEIVATIYGETPLGQCRLVFNGHRNAWPPVQALRCAMNNSGLFLVADNTHYGPGQLKICPASYEAVRLFGVIRQRAVRPDSRHWRDLVSQFWKLVDANPMVQVELGIEADQPAR